jgi:hypothetical protein
MSAPLLRCMTPKLGPDLPFAAPQLMGRLSEENPTFSRCGHNCRPLPNSGIGPDWLLGPECLFATR